MLGVVEGVGAGRAECDGLVCVPEREMILCFDGCALVAATCVVLGDDLGDDFFSVIARFLALAFANAIGFGTNASSVGA